MTKKTSYTTRTYRKIYALSVLVAVLALTYGATLVFDPERVNTRDSNFVWLDEKVVEQADSIEITGNGQLITLARRDAEWRVSLDDGDQLVDYPAKQLRIEDLLHVLSTKGSYAVRANTSHERFGLTDDAANRIVIRGGLAAAPLLDLLIGDTDSMGAVYMRKNNQDEVRAGVNSTLSGYAASAVTSWYNLRLFPEPAPLAASSAESGAASIGVDAVQRVVIQAPAPAVAAENAVSDANTAPEPLPPPAFSLTRNQAAWKVSDTGEEKDADTQSVESYIRTLLDIEGEDFFSAGETSGDSFNGPTSGWVRLELGDGTTRDIRLSPTSGEENRYHAIALGSGARSGFVFVFSEWRKNTLFRDTSYFVKQ
jgi:hypothetical protein